jgi:serine/threonine-protein kinase
MSDNPRRGSRHQGDPHDPLIGKHLDGRFRVLEWIGKGAYSNVYKAAQTDMGDRLVAIKVFRKAQSDFAMARSGLTSTNPFAHELRFNRMLKNGAVVRVVQVGRTDSGVDFIVMEYVDGTNLDRHLRKTGPLPIPHVVQLADQLLTFVDEAHHLEFAHCDLKPDNLMIRTNPNGQVRFKVLDLGQARFLRDARGQRNAAAGTPAFIAPEVALGLPVTVRSEIYSCGTILYEALTGKHAIQIERPTADGFYEYLRSPALPIPTVPLLELRPDCPEDLADLVMWSMEREPRKRPASAEELREAILDVAEGSGIHPEQMPTDDGLLGKVRGAFRRLLGR